MASRLPASYRYQPSPVFCPKRPSSQTRSAMRILRCFGFLRVVPLADVPADVVAREIRHAERAHREAELLDGLVDLLRRGALFQQQQCLLRILVDHAIADEAIADAGHHRGLADASRERHAPWPARRDCVFFARTTSSSFMMFAGLKKCMPSTSPGRFVNAAMRSTSSVEVLVARIAPRFSDLVELAEHRLLDGEIFEHRLDHADRRPAAAA